MAIGFPLAPVAHGTPLHDREPAPAAASEPNAVAAARSGLRYNGTIEGLDRPFAVAMNRYARKIYVTEPLRNRVVVFDRLGRRRGTFGSGVLSRPTGLAFDFSGNLAVVSAGAREIVLFSPSGSLLARAPVPTAAAIGLAFDPVGRRMLVTDFLADAVWITEDSGSWEQVRPPGLSAPAGAAAGDGRFLVVSSVDNRLMELSSRGDLIRALPLGGARRPLGVTIPPFENGLVVSSADTGSGLFGHQIGGPLTRFGAGGRMKTPYLPGSECTRVAFPDVAGDRVVVFDLPASGSCTQGLTLRAAVPAARFRRIAAYVVAENDSAMSLRARVSLRTGRGRAKRYRLRPMRTSLVAGRERKLQLRLPVAAAAGIRRAVAKRRPAIARLVFTVRNRAGDRRRVTTRVVLSSRALRRLAR